MKNKQFLQITQKLQQAKLYFAGDREFKTIFCKSFTMTGEIILEDPCVPSWFIDKSKLENFF